MIHFSQGLMPELFSGLVNSLSIPWKLPLERREYFVGSSFHKKLPSIQVGTASSS